MPTPAAPTMKAGPFSYGLTTTDVHTDLKPLIFGDRIHKWWVDRYPVASIVMKVGTVPTPSPEFHHFEQDEVPYFLTSLEGDTAAETNFGTGGGTLGVWGTQATRIVSGNVYMNTRTLECVLVVGSGTAPVAATITVVRGWGSKYPAAAILAGDKWVLVGTNFTEGDVAPPSISTLEVKTSFTIADFRDAVDLTDRARATEYLVEKDLWKREMQMKRHAHMRNLKMSYFFGGNGSSTSASVMNAAAIGHTTGVTGLINFISTNVWDLNGNMLTQPDLFDFIGSGIAPWNTEKTLIMATSAHVINIVNQWALDKIVVNAETLPKEWGIDITSLMLMGGRKVALVEETEFNNDPTLRGMAFIGAPQKYSKWRPFKGNGFSGETQFIDDILRENHPTRRKGEWFTSGGWEHFAERGWGFIKGITA